MSVTPDSRKALARAWFLLEKAKECPAAGRVDFEAYLEAAIIFARAAIHRFKTKHERHPGWKPWWDSLRGNAAVEFLRTERDFILKEAEPNVGQKIFMPSIGPGGTDVPAYTPTTASEFYYFETPDIEATATVERHLRDLEQVLTDAEARFR